MSDHRPRMFEEMAVPVSVLASDTVLVCLEAARADLGGRGVKLFSAALQKSKSHLLDTFIRPNLVRRNHSYIYIAEDKGGKGSRPNYDPGNSMFASSTSTDDDLAVPGVWGLFTNPLVWTGINEPGLKPSERAINVGFCVYTFEFDKASIADQLRIIYGGGLGRTDEILQRFNDYRGYEVVYGGGKSLHFHFVFDLRHWKHDLAFAGNSAYQDHWHADFPDRYLRVAHESRWEVIRNAFRRATGIASDPDPQLRYWEQNRRLPLAVRRVHKGHPLGLPAGSYVRQYVLASGIRRHVPRSGKSWLHFDGLLKRVDRRTSRSAARAGGDAVNLHGGISGADQSRFDAFLAMSLPKLIAGSDLRYGGVEFPGGEPTIHVFNNENDRTPSSIMRGDHDAVLLQGAHDFLDNVVPVGVTANRLYEAMLERDRTLIGQSEHPLDRAFQEEVQDLDGYRHFLSEHIGSAMKAAELVLILGPEGCGKSSAVMEQIPRLIAETEGTVFVSSPSYAQAAEKMKEFSERFWGTDYVSFEYLSLTELYRRHCPPSEYISEIDALDMGRSSWLATIFREQPEVYAEMREYRDELHALRQRGKIPVLFGVHETIRRYADTGMTRLFYAPGFDERWFESMDPSTRNKYRNELRYESTLAHVVFDEVSAADLLTSHAEPIVRWAKQFQRSIQHLSEHDKIGRYLEFKKFRSAHPMPSDEQCSGKSDWQTVQAILHARYDDNDDLVKVTADRLPFDADGGIYKERLGGAYFVRPRDWWFKVAPTTLLTTELVPAQIIEAFRHRSITCDQPGPDEAMLDDEGQVDLYRVFRFDRPGLFDEDGVVHVEEHKDAKRDTLPGLVKQYMATITDVVVISDMLGGRIDEKAGVTTHLSARGSNGLSERDIVAFYTAPSPSLFAQLAALDNRLGMRNSIALWYVDRFNQTCGRNRGFRAKHKRQHIAVMGHRMYRWLAPYLATWSRYTLARRRCSLTYTARG